MRGPVRSKSVSDKLTAVQQAFQAVRCVTLCAGLNVQANTSWVYSQSSDLSHQYSSLDASFLELAKQYGAVLERIDETTAFIERLGSARA